MNSLLTKNAMKINGLSLSKTTIAVVVLSALSNVALANRPAMENDQQSRPMQNEAATTQAVSKDVPAPRPQAEAPSAVESMMKRQGMQTGDVLQLPAKEMQPGETLKIKLLDTPRRGMSMEKVQQTFGQPMATSASVGKPPITSWTYNDRVVYFEYSTVLHVVAR